MRDALDKIWDRVKRLTHTESGVPMAYETMNEESHEYGSIDAPGTSQRTPSQGYTELMGGSVPCPSCKGTGRIPKEMEETLVALIPLNDERLKPKRTFIYVLIGIGICVLLASIAIFMLVPRSVDLSTENPSIDVISVTEHTQNPPLIKFNFLNHVNVANYNYYIVQVVNVTAQVISKFQPWQRDVIGTGFNESHVAIAPLSMSDENQLLFNNTVTLTDVVAEYCQQQYSRLTPLYVNMQFDVVVTFSYFNHKEQASLTTVQQVCCVPSGNCTSPF